MSLNSLSLRFLKPQHQRKRMIAAMIEHKGYIGQFEFDATTEIFRGKVVNSGEVLFFEGKTVEKTTKSFVEAVNAYLLQCERNGTHPWMISEKWVDPGF